MADKRITTFLEMRSARELRPKRSDAPDFRILEAAEKQWEFNRFLYGIVGGPWQWNDKLTWTPDQWRCYAENEDLRTFAGYVGGAPAGYFELQRDEARDVRIAYFGLTPRFIGRGLGGHLLTFAIEEAWAWGAKRVWVHTCNFDHPVALSNYKARGLRVYEVRED